MTYKRIVSLVPSLTELVLDLGIGDRLIGRTRFCIHPVDLVSDVPIIGGTKTLNIEKILSLKPDYIIANHEENRKEDIELLQKKVHVNITEIDTIHEALDSISILGNDLDLSQNADKLIEKIQHLLAETPKLPSIKTAYFIWKAPWMVAANQTYIDSIISHYNLENIFSDLTRYPEISLEDLERKSPELILLSSEPYPFKEKHIKEIKAICPDASIQLINGEWFSWYGSGMVKAFKELNSWRKML
ncbi:MAG: ABC transporter substrate-binding protein [Balneola sp.]